MLEHDRIGQSIASPPPTRAAFSPSGNRSFTDSPRRRRVIATSVRFVVALASRVLAWISPETLGRRYGGRP
jgi:hypothetical protein